MFSGCEPTRYEGWTSTWVVGVEERRCAVRAACDCGWRGPELPWPGPAATPWGAEPTDEQHDALMLVWDRHIDTLIATRQKDTTGQLILDRGGRHDR
jgi:hypothetical protein